MTPPTNTTIPTEGARSIAADVIKEMAGRQHSGVISMSDFKFKQLMSHAVQRGMDAATRHLAKAEEIQQIRRVRLNRGAIRLWAALSLVWIVVAAVLVADDMARGWSAATSTVAAVALAPPAIVLVAGFALLKLGQWVWSGFRGGL